MESIFGTKMVRCAWGTEDSESHGLGLMKDQAGYTEESNNIMDRTEKDQHFENILVELCWLRTESLSPRSRNGTGHAGALASKTPSFASMRV